MPDNTYDRLTAMFGEPIDVYTRAQLVEDGGLVAVPEQLAREAGIVLPMALSAAAWHDVAAWSETTEAAKPSSTGQSETGRLWDVLIMTHAAIRAGARGRQTFVPVHMLRVPPNGPSTSAEPVTLHVRIGPDDNGAPVLTVTLADET